MRLYPGKSRSTGPAADQAVLAEAIGVSRKTTNTVENGIVVPSSIPA